jgi:hypothetical protein
MSQLGTMSDTFKLFINCPAQFFVIAAQVN